MSMPPLVNKLPAQKDPEERTKREAEYQAEMAERGRKVRIMLARIEPTEDGADLGRYRFEASTAISLKRIADSLDQIAMEMRAANNRPKS